MGERNIVVENTGANPVIGYSFMLRVEGIYDLPCRAVKGFQRENEFEYIQEGGMNDYVHIKRKPITKPFTFQVERYVGIDMIDPLPLGSEPILPIILFVNACAFPKLKPVRTYTFTGCTVIAKDYGTLDAEKSGLVVETTTIAYREMVCVAVPTQALDLGETGMKHKRPHKENESEEIGYAERPKNEKNAANRRSAMEKAAKEKTWNKKSYAATPKTTEADSLAKRKEAAAENSWSVKAHAATPKTTEADSLAKRKEAAAKNSWSVKPHAATPKTTEADSLAKRKEAAAENSWSVKPHAATPKTTQADSLAAKKQTAAENSWSAKPHAATLETTEEDVSLSKMIEFSSKKVWPKESHAITLQKK